MKLTQEIVRELLDYVDGELIWKRRKRKYFKTRGTWKAWNRRYARQPAFAYLDPKGYARGGLFGRNYKRATIIWMYKTGRSPAVGKLIDHKDRRPSNDRWNNLQESTYQQNARNRYLPKNNRSGRVGVYELGPDRFQAKIGIDGRFLNLGSFPSFEAACQARALAERWGRYSPGHGRPRLHPRAWGGEA